MLECVDFRLYAFRDFIAPSLQAIASLMADTEGDEAKLRVLATLNSLLHRCRADVCVLPSSKP